MGVALAYIVLAFLAGWTYFIVKYGTGDDWTMVFGAVLADIGLGGTLIWMLIRHYFFL
jgi:hypothetical protein